MAFPSLCYIYLQGAQELLAFTVIDYDFHRVYNEIDVTQLCEGRLGISQCQRKLTEYQRCIMCVMNIETNFILLTRYMPRPTTTSMHEEITYFLLAFVLGYFRISASCWEYCMKKIRLFCDEFERNEFCFIILIIIVCWLVQQIIADDVLFLVMITIMMLG